MRDRRSLRQRRRATLDALVAAGTPLPTYDLLYGSKAGLLFEQKVAEAGFGLVTYEAWPCEQALADADTTAFRDGDRAVHVLADGTLALVAIDWGTLRITVAAPSRAASAAAHAAFRSAYPATYLVQGDELRVPVTFWTMGPNGPVQRMRMIGAQPWSEIGRNYPPDVREQLDGLMTAFTPGKTGQLMLWQGPPGTGKTWALRALASEWGPWAEFHYITDPDSFFVDNPIYMIDVLLSESVMALDERSGEMFDEADPEGKWRVLILEDTGELLSANAKEKYGQGLSRLLNVVDGMIGQGLRVLVLVTTNDELGELTPAVRRPGRCASQIEFRALTPEEAAEWLDGDADAEATLADLYARSSGGADALAEAPDVRDDVARVAEEHQAEATGYGQTAWDAGTGTVLYVAGDWTDVEPIRDDMLAIDGVRSFEAEFEAMPTGWCSAEVVYGGNPFDCDEAALDNVVALAAEPLEL